MSPGHPGSATAASPDPREVATAARISRRLYEALNRRDVDAVMALAHAEIEVHPLRAPTAWPVRGRDAFRLMLEDALAAGRGHQFDVRHVADLDDGRVVISGMVTELGTNAEFVALHRLEDGLHRHVHQYYSDEETLRQLGLIA